MELELEKISSQQKESWNRFAAGWKKWDDLMMDFLKPMGDTIIDLLDPKPDDTVLDIASGTGEPGLTIAAMPGVGKVVLTDLSEEMLGIARDNAAYRDLDNIETVVCDVCELPFADNTFDAISCRFGFMFFPDMRLAAQEMVRVLKPGGRIATSVWDGPDKNFWVTAAMEAISHHIEMPPPVQGAPGMFRCAKSGMIAELFSQVGLKNITELPVAGKLNTKTAEVYWNTMTEVAAPIVAALSKADEATREKVRQEVYGSLKRRYPDGNVVIDAGAIVIYGEK